jgi:hydroxymethylpyrimidine/phosphomethylpyrimidine kinase / thiaminase
MLYDAERVQAVVRTLRKHFVLSQPSPSPSPSHRLSGLDLDPKDKDKGVEADGRFRVVPVVVDPVCVSTSGHTLLERAAIRSLVDDLLPYARLVTPNKIEAELLLEFLDLNYDYDANEKKDKHVDDELERSQRRREIKDVDGAVKAATELATSIGCDVLLKGGHLTVNAAQVREYISRHPPPTSPPPSSESPNTHGGQSERVSASISWHDARPNAGANMEILKMNASKRSAGISPSANDVDAEGEEELVVDVLYELSSHSTTILTRSRLDSSSTHGTGCTLSSAIACWLARGKSSECISIFIPPNPLSGCNELSSLRANRL